MGLLNDYYAFRNSREFQYILLLFSIFKITEGIILSRDTDNGIIAQLMYDLDKESKLGQHIELYNSF